MENGLRELITNNDEEEFRGVYVEGRLSPTRRNILAPGSIGVYTGGSNYNPAQVLRDHSVVANTKSIDELLADVPNKTAVEVPVSLIRDLIALVREDPSKSELVWDPEAISAPVEQLAALLKHNTGSVYVDRDRGLEQRRRETQGILAGGEFTGAPTDRIGLFMLRTKVVPGKNAAWWPQVRFSSGQYAFAFAV